MVIENGGRRERRNRTGRAAVSLRHDLSLDELVTRGWPQWRITVDTGKEPTKTLGLLVWHLRNAVSHYGLRFTSDEAHLEDVAIKVEDRPRKGAKPNWQAEIRGVIFAISACDLLILWRVRSAECRVRSA